MKLGEITVGWEKPPYYIADIGANHDGNLDRALRLIELAKEAGAHAAKFQNFKAETIVSNEGFKSLKTTLSHQSNWKKSVFEVYKDASINMDWTPVLAKKCKEVGIEYFTSPYDLSSVDHVDPYVNFYKIGSGDITWLEIIRHIASKGKPVLIASGASEMSDVQRAMKVLSEYDVPVCLMQCNTNYTLEEDKYKYVNLNVLNTYKREFPDVILGLSDHTRGDATTVGAIALGARIIEKHFTDDNKREGPDHKFAMNPQSWREMVNRGDEVFYAMGDGVKRVELNEKDSMIVQQRSLHASGNLANGKILKAEDFVALRPRPQGSFEPYRLPELIGKVVTVDIQKGQTILADFIK